MTDDLLTRLTTALMDAMGCKEASIFGPGNCRLHVNVLRPGPKHMGWPCPVAERVTAALLADPAAHAAMLDALVSAGVLHERATLTPISVECTIPDCPRCRGNWRVLMPPGGEPAPRAHFEFHQGRRYVTEWEVLSDPR